MKFRLLTLCVLVILSVRLHAQLPAAIQDRLTSLTTQVDQMDGTNAEGIEKAIAAVIDNAPNQAMKKAALNFVLQKSKSSEVKAVVNGLIKGLSAPADNSNYILLNNATILDMVSDTGKKGSLLIKDDRIERISYSAPIRAPAGATVYDLDGKYIIPGLIDNHVHITHGTLKDAQEHLEVALKQGLTGVRDMGGDGRMLTVLKKNMQIGEELGPDVFFSTIIAGPSFFENDPRPQQVAKGAKAGEVSWQRAITPDTDFKQVIAEAKGLGATAIKVYASVDKDLFKLVADEAKKQGLKVWAHAAIPPTRPSEVSNGGADAMSHAGDMIGYELVEEARDRHSFKTRAEAQAYRTMMNTMAWDDNTPGIKNLFNTMKQNNSILDATIFVYYYTAQGDSSRYKAGLRVTKAAHDAGVKIGAGSDHMIDLTGYAPVINLHKELELLVAAGLSNIDALRAGTIINAETLGEENNIGTVEEGKLANLVILNADPLETIGNTRNIKAVIKRGKVID